MYKVECERCGTLRRFISDEEAGKMDLCPEEREEHIILDSHYGCPVCAYNEMLERQEKIREKALKRKSTPMTLEERNNKHRVKAYTRKKKSTDWYKTVEKYYTEEV